LVVEDDPATRSGLVALLREAGYEPVEAATLQEGRLALEQGQPDLLIADLRLGGFNGLQLLHVSPRPVPAIMVTGFPDEMLQAEARRLGAEYLVKPVAVSRLIDMVRRMLAQTHRREDRRQWPRRRVRTDMPAENGAAFAHVLDLSYGGVRVDVAVAADAVPDALHLVFPLNRLAVDVDVVWRASERAGRLICGGTIDPVRNPDWRTFVDANT
jgi:DNA-binding response OmpR family regulator